MTAPTFIRPKSPTAVTGETRRRLLTRGLPPELAREASRRLELLSYVLAKVPLDREGRLKAYELRISLEQRVQAVRWRLSTELLTLPVAPGDMASRVAACNDELSDECSSLEGEGERAWLHLCGVLQAVSPFKESP